MNMKTVKRLALFAVLTTLFVGSLQLIVTELEARGGRGGGGRGGGRGGGHRGGGRGGGHRGGGHRGGRGHHGRHGRHRHGGRHGWNRGGYGYGYGGGYWGANGAWIAPAVVGGVALGAAAASSGGTTVIEDDGYQADDSYPTCGQYQYFNPATGRCEDAQVKEDQEIY